MIEPSLRFRKFANCGKNLLSDQVKRLFYVSLFKYRVNSEPFAIALNLQEKNKIFGNGLHQTYQEIKHLHDMLVVEALH